MSSIQKPPVCIVSCSVLRKELEQLKKEGKLDAELVFVSKNFHVDYAQLETNLRRMLDHTKGRFKGKIVLVYGDLCLGQDNEMKKLGEEFGVQKVDALNCVDCQMGGGGKSLEADPNHNLMFMGPGMVEFFEDMREILRGQGVDDETFEKMFSGIKGIVLLDTVGNAAELKEALGKSGMNLEVLETRKIGCEGVLSAVLDAIKRA
jgi:hypothetical protein